LGYFSLYAVNASELDSYEGFDGVLISNNTLNSIVAFGAPQLSISRLAHELHLQYEWMNLTGSPTEYSVTVLIQNTTLLPSIDVVNIQSRGLLSSSGQFSLLFNQALYGETPIVVIIQITSTDSPDTLFFSLSLLKKTNVPDCTGLCDKGVCFGELCSCDTDWGNNWDCSFLFTVIPSQVCLGERFKVFWNRSDAQKLDWISFEDPLVVSAFAPDGEFKVFADDAVMLWTYTGTGDHLAQTTETNELYPAGFFEFSLFDNSRVGPYAIIYFKKDEYNYGARAIIDVLPLNDSRCWIGRTPGECYYGTWNNATHQCDCEPLRFGIQCEFGCAPMTVLTEFGAEFASSSGPELQYLNRVECQWLIKPNFSMSIAEPGIVITFTDFGLEPNDLVNIYAGEVMDETTLVTIDPLSGILGTGGFQLVLNASAALVVFTTSRETPSVSDYGIYGFRAVYRATGCPPGFFVESNNLTGIYSCTACPPTEFTFEADTLDQCLPCSQISKAAKNQLLPDDLARYNQFCVPKIVAWRKVMSYIVIILTSINLIVTSVLLLGRRSIRPLRSRSIITLFAMGMDWQLC